MKKFLTCILITTMTLSTPVSAHTNDIPYASTYNCSVAAHDYVKMPGYFTQDIVYRGKKTQRKYIVRRCRTCQFEKYDLYKRAVKGGF